MICDKTIRDGTNQLERKSEFLKNGFVKVDERSQTDLLGIIYEFAAELAFYNPSLEFAGNWQEVLGELSDLQNLLPPGEQDKLPHIGLLIALTKLSGYAQDEINTITERHLNYYYREVLRIQPKQATPDQVQLVLHLAKSNTFDEFLLKANTAFNAGKDTEGKPLIYKTDKEAVISRAKIQQIKTLFLDKKDNDTRIFMAPVANSSDGLGAPLEENTPFWPALGESQIVKSIEERTMVDAAVGFAISSSVLLLKEGDRIIDVDINFSPNPDLINTTSLQNSFTVYYTGEKEWVEAAFHTSELVKQELVEADIDASELVEEEIEDTWQLRLHIEINIAQPAFSFFDPDIHPETFLTKGPTLKVILKPECLGYDTLKQLKVSSVDIEVEANGMKNHLLQSNSGVLNPQSPFLPFGAQPVLNNSFYIGNAEIFYKRLYDLTISLDWHEIPNAFFSEHYSGYIISEDFGNNSFQVRLDLLLNQSWNRLKSPATIFDDSDADSIREINISKQDFDLAITSENYTTEPPLEPISLFTVNTNRGFLKIELISPKKPSFKAFGHKEFPQLYTEQAIALATRDPAIEPPPKLPNAPYTPTIKELSINYKSRQSIQINTQNEYDALFQIGPFGFRPIDTIYHKELIPFIEEEGALIIGLDGFSPPQTLNLLFDLEEGTAKRSVVLEHENITWNYLAENRWIELSPQEVLVDGTRDFKQSGIISLIIPKNASNANDYLPQGLFWIKAKISEGAEGANKIKSIFSNAVNATLDTYGEDYDAHLTEPIAAGSIASLSNRVKEIKSVEQPLKSNKGLPGESAIAFNSRVSERLRHKNRAAQLWDYERMILEAFPNIFKVKCLAHTGPESESDAGSVTLIVVSNLRNKDASNPFQPGTSQLVLDEVEAFMKDYISPFIKIYVELPHYESILVDAKIGFQPGFDPGFYSNQLNQELKEFLSPWAFMDGVDIEIGGAIYKSSILQFIESRLYVDYVVDFNLYHKGGRQLKSGISEMEIALDFEIANTINPGIGEMILGNSFVVGEDVNLACASGPRSILVSAQDHRVTALRPDEYECSGASSLGIGFMTVNLDLVINE